MRAVIKKCTFTVPFLRLARRRKRGSGLPRPSASSPRWRGCMNHPGGRMCPRNAFTRLSMSGFCLCGRPSSSARLRRDHDPGIAITKSRETSSTSLGISRRGQRRRSSSLYAPVSPHSGGRREAVLSGLSGRRHGVYLYRYFHRSANENSKPRLAGWFSLFERKVLYAPF